MSPLRLAPGLVTYAPWVITARQAPDTLTSSPVLLGHGAMHWGPKACRPVGSVLLDFTATVLVSFSHPEIVPQVFIVQAVLKQPCLMMGLREIGVRHGITVHRGVHRLCTALMEHIQIAQVLQNAATVPLDGCVWRVRTSSCVQRGITAWGAQWRTFSPALQAHTALKQDKAK
nr:uncharacterized protein LOC108179232 isoform X2 [Danio rerio]|eukprot:XP_021322085.1 uncharacterized protein LOC108179232 isoform X2 [Danio rerio]